MFAKVALFTLASAAFVAATTTVTATNPSATAIAQCNTGDAQCCNSVNKVDHPAVTKALGLLDIVVQGVDVLVGAGCTPITAVGLGQGANCAQQPVCCQNNQFNGLVNIGCSPISL